MDKMCYEITYFQKYYLKFSMTAVLLIMLWTINSYMVIHNQDIYNCYFTLAIDTAS
jgi:hypothetical protein